MYINAVNSYMYILVQPYISTFLIVFDGIILQLIVIISGLSVVELVDNYNEMFVVGITYLFVLLPLMSFVAINFG